MIKKVLLVLALACPGGIWADGCDALQGQTIRFIVPSQAGGGYDAYSRLLQPFLEGSLNARIVIENRPQAGGLVAAVMIRDADPDGRTLGIINAAGLLAARVSALDMATARAPDPSEDFTVLARVVANHMMLFTGRDSGISDLGELLRISAARPVVVGVRDAGSASYFVFPIAARYLGLNYSLVTGYVGSSSRVLASLRGEVDIILQTLDSVMPYVKSGELVPLVWVTDPAGASQRDELPFKVPVLGEWVDESRQGGGNDLMGADTLEPGAAAISAMLSAGRLVMAPRGLDPALQTCLQDRLVALLQSNELMRAANAAGLSMDPADASQALAELKMSRRYMEQYAPLMRAAIDETRQ
jgi:tripartite-type tricarboxylate transporter receptor subunit TctC